MEVVLVEDVPKFTFTGGLFYIQRSGGQPRAMRPNTFFAMVAAAADAGKQFKFGDADILPFPAKDEASG